MLTIAAILFALAAILGIYLISYILTDKNTPKGVVLIHGAFAASGLILLIVYSILYQAIWSSLILFILAACGGLFMFKKDLFNEKIPKILPIGHGLIAVCGFILLILFIFNH